MLGDSLLRELGETIYRMVKTMPGVECVAYSNTLENTTIVCNHEGMCMRYGWKMRAWFDPNSQSHEFTVLGRVSITRYICGTRWNTLPKLRDEFVKVMPTASPRDIILMNAGLHFPPSLTNVAGQYVP